MTDQTPCTLGLEEIARTILPMFDQLATSVYGDGPYSEAESAMEAASALMPLVKRAQAEARARELRDFRASLITDQLTRYGNVLPDIHDVVDALDERATQIENKGAGA